MKLESSIGVQQHKDEREEFSDFNDDGVRSLPQGFSVISRTFEISTMVYHCDHGAMEVPCRGYPERLE
ncbi:hypothetical protein D3C85_1160390 [compost metagenome]